MNEEPLRSWTTSPFGGGSILGNRVINHCNMVVWGLWIVLHDYDSRLWCCLLGVMLIGGCLCLVLFKGLGSRPCEGL